MSTTLRGSAIIAATKEFLSRVIDYAYWVSLHSGRPHKNLVYLTWLCRLVSHEQVFLPTSGFAGVEKGKSSESVLRRASLWKQHALRD
jgi:hypothetical protein